MALMAVHVADTAADFNMYDGPEVGIASSGWNSDDGGSHRLYADTAEEGMQAVRLTLPVNNPGPYMPDIRAQINSAIANGQEPVINLQQSRTDTPSTYPQKAAQLAATLPRVDDFVLGNEWNSPYFSNRNLTVEDVVRLTYLTNKDVHAVRPDAKTRGLALASGFGQVAFMAAATPIANQEFGGWQNVFDAVDWHEYHSLEMDEQIVKADEQYYDGPAYLGEIGWKVSRATDSPGAVSETQQAVNEVSLIDDLSEDPQIKGIYFYLYQNSSDPTDPFKMANVLANGTKLLSFFSLQSKLTGQ
jgi:hypothetical protein